MNPYENNRWGKIFEGEVAETPNLQDTCALVWHTYHVSDDPKGSKYCPQGGNFVFLAICPLAPTPLDLESPNLVPR